MIPDTAGDESALLFVRQLMQENAGEFVRAMSERTSVTSQDVLVAIRRFLEQQQQPGSEAAPEISAPPLAATPDRMARYVASWTGIVPRQPDMQAAVGLALAHSFGSGLTNQPAVRQGLHLDDAEVVTATRELVEANVAFAQEPGAEIIETPAGPDVSELELAIEREAHLILLQKGGVLCREGDAAAFHLLISGRLGAFEAGEHGEERLVDDVAPGETIGEMEILEDSPYLTTVRALRDSTVVTIDRSACTQLVNANPRFLLAITSVVIRRLRDVQSARPRIRMSGLRTIALLPLSPTVPVGRLGRDLVSAFATYGNACHITRQDAEEALEGGQGSNLLADTYDDRLVSWVNQREAQHEFVVYEGEPELNPWTMRCIRQSDQIMLVAEGADNPDITTLELHLGDFLSSSQLDSVQLILLHDATTSRPSATEQWLDPRHPHDHHHIRLDRSNDLGYLVRRLTGQAVGLVLGGGGARAFAAIGAIQAIEEAGVPIDLVGGTSGGSIMAAQLASGWDRATMIQRARDLMGTKKQVIDYTLPVVSLASAGKLKRILQTMFGDSRIEDLWRPFFCCTSNITRAELAVHRSGPVWHYVRASCSIPAVFPPVLDGTDLLVDGMLLSNLPVDTMRGISGVGPVIAIDVSAKEDKIREFQFGASLSASEALLGRFHPDKQRRIKAPSIVDVVLRTSEIGSIYWRKVQAQHASIYVAPPVSEFGVFETDAIGKLVEIGYESTRVKLEEGADAPWMKAFKKPAPKSS